MLPEPGITKDAQELGQRDPQLPAKVVGFSFPLDLLCFVCVITAPLLLHTDCVHNDCTQIGPL